MKKMGAFAVVASTLFVTACSSTMNNAMTEKQKSIELYRVFDIKTSADRYEVRDAASDGLGANVSSADEHNPIVWAMFHKSQDALSPLMPRQVWESKWAE